MNLLKLYNKLSSKPMGKYLFSKAFCMKAPYFGTIRPYFSELKAGKCVIEMKNRRAIHNHIGTVHAIAMCNMAEAAGGLCLEVSLPKHLRWIPKGMTVEYLKKATTNLKGVCEFDPQEIKVGDNNLEVNIYDANDVNVFRANISMYVSEKSK